MEVISCIDQVVAMPSFIAIIHGFMPEAIIVGVIINPKNNIGINDLAFEPDSGPTLRKR